AELHHRRPRERLAQPPLGHQPRDPRLAARKGHPHPVSAARGARAGAGRWRQGSDRVQRFMKAGSHSEMTGHATRIDRPTMSATTKGHTRRKIWFSGTWGSKALMTKRFMPTGGEIMPISITVTISTPNHTGSKPRPVMTGKNTGMVSSTMDSSSITRP